MVRLQLSIKADLENVTGLVPATDDFVWFFQVKCTSCHEIHPKFVGVSRSEEMEVAGGRGATANFAYRCGFCKRESSAKFEQTSPATAYNAENAQFGPLLIIECRGLEFVDFDPSRGKNTWKCVGTESGTVFADVTIEDGEWCDFDEKGACPVSIGGIESSWKKA